MADLSWLSCAVHLSEYWMNTWDCAPQSLELKKIPQGHANNLMSTRSPFLSARWSSS